MFRIGDRMVHHSVLLTYLQNDGIKNKNTFIKTYRIVGDFIILSSVKVLIL